jgi:hydrogenase small subunit
MIAENGWLMEALKDRGVTRRDFLSFCSMMAVSLGLPKSARAQIADAIEHNPKPSLVWLEFQDCAGNTESFLRASKPSVAEIILETLSIDYHETIMAAAGHQAEAALAKTVKDKAGEFLVIVEGSIPAGDGGVYCTIGGRSAIDIVRDICPKAAATIAIGTCAAFGGLPAAAPNPTGALSVDGAVPGLKTLINLPACPANAENLTALLVYYLTFQRWPPLDSKRRPLFAHGKSIHDNCERRAHFDAGQYVESFGDEAHRTGYCLYKVGCKGPVTYQNCPVIRWNDGTNWPIGCGHPCIGCAEPAFWDTMTPFYEHLPDFPGFNDAAHIDTLGLWAAAGVAAGFAGHGMLSIAKSRMGNRPPRSASPPPATPTAPDAPASDAPAKSGGAS